MGNHLQPGPPLIPGEEFCACETPSHVEYLKAVGSALLVMLLGAGGWSGMTVATGRIWSFTTVLLGMAAGWAVHRAAGRHRSRALGIIAGAAAILAVIVGYALLWAPFVRLPSAGWPLGWYDLFMAGLGAFIAFRLAGPKPKSSHSL